MNAEKRRRRSPSPIGTLGFAKPVRVSEGVWAFRTLPVTLRSVARQRVSKGEG